MSFDPHLARIECTVYAGCRCLHSGHHRRWRQERIINGWAFTRPALEGFPWFAYQAHGWDQAATHTREVGPRHWGVPRRRGRRSIGADQGFARPRRASSARLPLAGRAPNHVFRVWARARTPCASGGRQVVDRRGGVLSRLVAWTPLVLARAEPRAQAATRVSQNRIRGQQAAQPHGVFPNLETL